MGKWRAGALILVHVLIGIHVVQWLVHGMTLSPVEPSESMHTLRDGVVNAGFVFFVLAIASTLIMGRFFCGWACHVVALQDLCSWMMTKIGIRPKPFRSRLLIYVPLALALYMFVWPVVHREVLRPLLADGRGRMPVWLGQSEPLPGIRTEFLVEDFWATFPTWYVAIPFLLLIGFACVYFLGSKGFCTYGCPYGGFFAPADLVAPGKIRVHTDRCEQCGHCTAACTSNVRVHEEVHNYGMVVDPGCMKCLDCVSVCPNDALYVGLGKPTVLARPLPGREDAAAKSKAMREARYDLSTGQEWIAAALFLVLFLCYRGMLNQVPMLMAVGMAGIGVWSAFLAARLVSQPHVRLQNLQLKLKGRVRPLGAVFGLFTVSMLALAAWSGAVRWNHWQASQHYAHLETPLNVVLRPDFEPTATDRRHAESALRHYTLASPREQGGFGWALKPDDLINVAYMQLLVGRPSEAEATMQRVLLDGRPRDSLVFQLATIMQMRGATEDEVLDVYRRALAAHDGLHAIRDRLARERLAKGDKEGAIGMWTAALAAHPRSADAKMHAAAFFADAGDKARGRALIDDVLKEHAEEPDRLIAAAQLLASPAFNERPKALELVRAAAEQARGNASQRLSAASLLAQLGDSERALMEALRGVERSRERGRHLGKPNILFQAGVMHLSMGRREQGLALVREAVKNLPGGEWDLAGIGAALVNMGLNPPGAPRGSRDDELIREGVAALTKARDDNPHAPTIRYDLAIAYYASGQRDKAIPEIKAAAETATSSAFLAQRYAQLLAESGRQAEAETWLAEAARRQKQRPGPTPGRP